MWSVITVLSLRLFGGHVNYFESVKSNRWFEREPRPITPIGTKLMSQSFSILTLEELATWLTRESALAVRLLGSLSIFRFQIKLRNSSDLKDEQVDILREEFYVGSVSIEQ